MKRLLAILPVLVLAGCGASPGAVVGRAASRATSGPWRRRSRISRTPATKNEPQRICSDILARALVQQLEAAGADCTVEMRKAIEDADDRARRPQGDHLGLDGHRDGAARRRRHDPDDGVHARGRRVARHLAQRHLGSRRLRRHQQLEEGSSATSGGAPPTRGRSREASSAGDVDAVLGPQLGAPLQERAHRGDVVLRDRGHVPGGGRARVDLVGRRARGAPAVAVAVAHDVACPPPGRRPAGCAG